MKMFFSYRLAWLAGYLGTVAVKLADRGEVKIWVEKGGF